MSRVGLKRSSGGAGGPGRSRLAAVSHIGTWSQGSTASSPRVIASRANRLACGNGPPSRTASSMVARAVAGSAGVGHSPLLDAQPGEAGAGGRTVADHHAPDAAQCGDAQAKYRSRCRTAPRALSPSATRRALSPAGGLGANTALHDAAVLAALLAEPRSHPDPATALAGYETRILDHAASAVAASLAGVDRLTRTAR